MYMNPVPVCIDDSAAVSAVGKSKVEWQEPAQRLVNKQTTTLKDNIINNK